MILRRIRCYATFVCFAWAAACGTPESTERLVVISNDERVGELTASLDDQTVLIDYAVDSNGRGPKIKERLVLDNDGYPVEWTIAGESLFGAEVDESYLWVDGEACWKSQADQGCVTADSPPLYVDNDGSPWALGLYARALLAEPDRSLDVLPAGRIRLSELARMTLDGDKSPVTLYALKGLSLSPQVIVLDEANRLFGIVSGGGMTIREGYEEHQELIRQRAQSIEIAERKAMHERLRHVYDPPVRIDNVHVFDSMSGRRGEPTSVIVEGGVIQSIGVPSREARNTSALVVIDGEGGTLVPGLYDMHAHNSFDSVLLHLAAGVTSTRDMGNEPSMLADLMGQIQGGELAGPRITPAGLIEARTPFSVRTGIIADTVEDALDAVRWYAENDYYEIKIYNSMIPAWVPPIVEEAGKHGLGVTGHVPAFTTPDEMIVAGYDSIAHLNQLMLGWLLEPGEDTRTPLRLTGMQRAHDLDLSAPAVRKTVELMREHDVAVDTTAIILERLMISRAGEVQPGDEPYLDHMPIGYRRYRKRTFVPLDSPADSEKYEEAFRIVLDTITLLHDNQVELLIGTDDGTGFSVHRELELYVEAGIPAGTTLAIASLGAARYLGQDERLGRIVPGFLADFFLVPGDPTKDISAIRQIRMVSAGGVYYFPEEIYEASGILPFGSRPAIDAAGSGH
jgi:imidazolonepropionase-like amidohydrolase